MKSAIILLLLLNCNVSTVIIIGTVLKFQQYFSVMIELTLVSRLVLVCLWSTGFFYFYSRFLHFIWFSAKQTRLSIIYNILLNTFVIYSPYL